MQADSHIIGILNVYYSCISSEVGHSFVRPVSLTNPAVCCGLRFCELGQTMTEKDLHNTPLWITWAANEMKHAEANNTVNFECPNSTKLGFDCSPVCQTNRSTFFRSVHSVLT